MVSRTRLLEQLNFFSLGWQHFHRMITTVPLLIIKIKRTTLFFVLISIENIKTRKSNFYEDNMVSRMHIWCIRRNVSLILINYIKKFQSLKTHKHMYCILQIRYYLFHIKGDKTLSSNYSIFFLPYQLHKYFSLNQYWCKQNTRM